MKIPSWSYFLFWATISIVFSRLGFSALDETDLSNSVSPLLLSFFKHSIAIFACLSCIYAFLFSPRLKISFSQLDLLFLSMSLVIYCTIFYFIFGSLPFVYFSLFTSVNLLKFVCTVLTPNLASTRTNPEFKILVITHLAAGSSSVLVGDQSKFFPCVISSIVLYLAISWLAVSENETTSRLFLPLAARAKGIVLFMKRKNGKLIEFGFGMAATILFQNYFRLASFKHVVAFLYFAVAWMANLALVRAIDDLGIFYFLLSNVIVGCTVSQFGLKGTTWIVFGASFLLFSLRLKLQSLSFVDDRDVQVMVWQS